MTAGSSKGSKPTKRPRATGKTGARNAEGRFVKGGPAGPGRGHRRKPGDLARQPSPAGRPAGGGVAYGELASRLELREVEVDRLRSELVEANRRLGKAGAEWSVVLAVLAGHPSVKDEILSAVFGAAESPERGGRGLLGGATAGQAVPAGEAAAEGAAARPGGDQRAGQAAGAPPPVGRGDTRAGPAAGQTVSDGVGRRDIRDINPGWGGRLERGGGGGRDEILDPSPERGRGRWGDEPPF